MSQLSEEESNFLRFYYLNLKIASKAVRVYFDSVHPPSGLAAELGKTSTSVTLKGLRFITKPQLQKLYPSTGRLNKLILYIFCSEREAENSVAKWALCFTLVILSANISIRTRHSRFPFCNFNLPQPNDMKLIHKDYYHISQIKFDLGGVMFTALKLCPVIKLFASGAIICTPWTHSQFIVFFCNLMVNFLVLSIK